MLCRLVCLLCVAIVNPVFAATPTLDGPPPRPVLVSTPMATPPAPSLQAKGYILLDAASGNVLASQNPDERMAPASLTKMMTSYIISTALKEKRISLDDQVRISEKAWRMGGSKMFVKVGDTISVRDLLQGIIVQSGNDACTAIAEHLAGTEEAFANLMNQQAAALGMKNTHYVDSTGLPHAEQYTTPRDTAILARALIQHYPEDYKWYSQKWFVFGGIKQPNRNRLLWRDPTVDGIKTGHTDEAGYCLAASALRNGTRLISVVMGAASDSARADETQKVLNYGFHFFETKKLYAANTILIKHARVWSSKPKQIPLGILRDTYITLPTGQYAQLKPELIINYPIKAPVQKGQTLGKVELLANGKSIGSIPVVALEDAQTGGLWTRMIDATHLTIRGWMGKKS